MTFLASTLFVFGFALAASVIWNSIVPQRARIWRLLSEGVPQEIVALPPVRLTSRTGIIRQRMAAPRPALRAAA